MLRGIPLKNIKIDDSFWQNHLGLVHGEIIPYQWEALNDRLPDIEPSHCIDNLRIAAKQLKGEYNGFICKDSELAKWLEAASYSLATNPDPKLERMADEAIELVCAAQEPDGYLNSYYTIKHPGMRWRNLKEGHELYCAGHMMEAAVAYYETTGKRRLLDAMIRFADLICDTFGPDEGKMQAYCGHQEIELALVKMHKATGTKKYLDMACYFINIRGVGENYFAMESRKPDYPVVWSPANADYDTTYSQSHLPVREQTKAVGHAVRAVYMYCAMADLAQELGDDGLLKACDMLWDSITEKQMYVTGGIGSSGILERFSTDYDLSNEVVYAESCASIGLALLGLRMNRITGNAKYFDAVERALYNTVTASTALDGKSYFYVNPLEVWPDACMPHTSKGHIKPVRQKWFDCACCPPNIARTFASLGQYIWAEDDDRLYINLFVNSSVISNGGAEVRLETMFPLKNTLKLTASKTVEMAVRIPDYAMDFTVNLPYKVDNAYAVFTLDKTAEICFGCPARFIYANPQVRANAGKVCVQRGPLVYCLEQIDNGDNLSALSVDTKKPLSEQAANIPGGLIIMASGKRRKPWSDNVLYGEQESQDEETLLRFTPYAFWGNRSPGEMLVWVRED